MRVAAKQPDQIAMTACRCDADQGLAHPDEGFASPHLVVVTINAQIAFPGRPKLDSLDDRAIEGEVVAGQFSFADGRDAGWRLDGSH